MAKFKNFKIKIFHTRGWVGPGCQSRKQYGFTNYKGKTAEESAGRHLNCAVRFSTINKRTALEPRAPDEKQCEVWRLPCGVVESSKLSLQQTQCLKKSHTQASLGGRGRETSSKHQEETARRAQRVDLTWGSLQAKLPGFLGSSVSREGSMPTKGRRAFGN